MTSLRSGRRFDQIVTGAGRAFGRLGFKRTQMTDIAKEAGVALGTLYGYSASKEALFELALLRAMGVPAPELRRLAAPGGAFERSVLDIVRERIVERELTPILDGALETGAPDSIEDEVRAIAGELYDLLDAMGPAIRMLDRSTNEWPELERLFVEHMRAPCVERLARYIELRGRTGVLPAHDAPAVAARLVVETCAWMAMHRRFTSGGPVTDDATAHECCVRFVAGALLHEQTSGDET